ncbi:MAG: hypothetical protein LBB90_10700, partial [Tannerella sp.]|nr:hypothetical protein [Tannerella sp.]
SLTSYKRGGGKSQISPLINPVVLNVEPEGKLEKKIVFPPVLSVPAKVYACIKNPSFYNSRRISF